MSRRRRSALSGEKLPILDAWPGLLATGQLIEASDMSERFGISELALNRAIARNRLFDLEYAGKRYVPAFYADGRHVRSQLEAVTRTLGSIPGGSKWQFYTNPLGSLSGRTPLKALLDGDFAKVRVAAAAFASI